MLDKNILIQLQSPSGASSRPSSVASGGNGSSCGTTNKAKVPQSFGYVKRQNGMQQPAAQTNGTAQQHSNYKIFIRKVVNSKNNALIINHT